MLRLGAQPPQHRDGLRHRVVGVDLLHRDGAGGGRHVASGARGGGVPSQEAPLGGRAGRRRIGQGARRRHRPSGLEARESDAHARRVREDPGFRAREAHPNERRPRGGDPPAHGDEGNGARGRDGDGRIHVARAGERPASGLPVRPVFVRRDPLRDGDRQARLRAADRGRDARGDHSARAGAPGRARSVRSAAAALGDRAVPGQGPRRSVRSDPGSVPGSGRHPGSSFGGFGVGSALGPGTAAAAARSCRLSGCHSGPGGRPGSLLRREESRRQTDPRIPAPHVWPWGRNRGPVRLRRQSDRL